MKCIHCKNELLKVQKEQKQKYCSVSCQQAYQRSIMKQEWLNGRDNLNPKTLKKLLIEYYGYKCNVCKNSEWNGQAIALETEHKDGNSQNNRPENLCLLCPNCHAQTPTYKAKNKGNGRHYRRQRYADGKSF